ncbi:MAG: DivIVA domain-containing protein [Streptosporangiaceae bacterium]
MARFPIRARGYFGNDVDTLIARIDRTVGRAASDAPVITVSELRAARLSTVLRGYDRRAVDDALSEYVRELEAFERGDQDTYTETVSGQVSWLIGWIQEAEFGVSRVRVGYAERDVDAFLERVLAGLRGDAAAVTARDARESVFRSVVLGPGYNESEVDAFLDQLAAALEHLQQGSNR